MQISRMPTPKSRIPIRRISNQTSKQTQTTTNSTASVVLFHQPSVTFPEKSKNYALITYHPENNHFITLGPRAQNTGIKICFFCPEMDMAIHGWRGESTCVVIKSTLPRLNYMLLLCHACTYLWQFIGEFSKPFTSHIHVHNVCVYI